MTAPSKFCRILCLLAISTLAQAKVASIDLIRLANLSQLIVIGDVTAVRTVAGGQVASVKTIFFVKGAAECPIAYVAEPTWKCDISEAIVGERVLLYLSPAAATGRTMFGQDLSVVTGACKRKGIQLYVLSHSGRGRVPLKQARSIWIANVKKGPATAPQLNVNLTLPWSAPIKQNKDGSSFVTQQYLVQHTKAAGSAKAGRRARD